LSKFFILCLDVGTSSTRAVVINDHGDIVSQSQKIISTFSHNPVWVEEDPMEIWEKTRQVALRALKMANVSKHDEIIAGIATQRNTMIPWDIETGVPLYHAITWQDRRDYKRWELLRQNNKVFAAEVYKKTGRPIDAGNGVSKIIWMLEHCPEVKASLKRGTLKVGGVDTWLIGLISGFKKVQSDYTNACVSGIFDFQSQTWSQKLLKFYNIPVNILPDLVPPVGNFGKLAFPEIGIYVPVVTVVGDQAAALYAADLSENEALCMLGSGGFILLSNTLSTFEVIKGFCNLVGWSDENKIVRVLQGMIPTFTTVIDWVIREWGLSKTPQDLDRLAKEGQSINAPFFIPALTGFGSPYFDMNARAVLWGVDIATTRAHMAWSIIESLIFTIRLILETVQQNSHILCQKIKVAGGPANSNIFVQMMADCLGQEVVRLPTAELTILGIKRMVCKSIITKQDNFTENCLKYAPNTCYKSNNAISSMEERRYILWSRDLEKFVKKRR